MKIELAHDASWTEVSTEGWLSLYTVWTTEEAAEEDGSIEGCNWEGTGEPDGLAYSTVTISGPLPHNEEVEAEEWFALIQRLEDDGYEVTTY